MLRQAVVPEKLPAQEKCYEIMGRRMVEHMLQVRDPSSELQVL